MRSDNEGTGQPAAVRHQPAFWKRWALSMVAVYPPLVCLVLLSQYLLDGLPMLMTLFVIAACLTGLSTGLILPYLNKRLSEWLHQ